MHQNMHQEGQPIAFDSRKFNKVELNYTASEQEMLASVRTVQTWRCYLEGSKFTLVEMATEFLNAVRVRPWFF